ncbi:MAG TPA: putative addiction module antidote protein [bacterium]|nr:putative addiction module antidote protein [bacterium]
MAKRKVAKSGDYRKYLLGSLKDPEEAAAYINAALDERDDPEALLVALRNVIEAHDGMTSLAFKSGLNRVSLYRMLSQNGNPRLESLSAVLQAMGLRLKVEQKVAS